MRRMRKCVQFNAKANRNACNLLKSFDENALAKNWSGLIKASVTRYIRNGTYEINNGQP